MNRNVLGADPGNAPTAEDGGLLANVMYLGHIRDRSNCASRNLAHTVGEGAVAKIDVIAASYLRLTAVVPVGGLPTAAVI
ncbi:MAG: hypothetical protein EPN30_09970 [Actinomycetota bacterium]|nr:MAG: hypothetical protein EPN30_09970 [Actinomycetota bacterium]